MNEGLFIVSFVLFVAYNLACNLLFYRWGYRNGRKDREWQD